MKGIQEREGKDKLQVLLLSVDAGYGISVKEAAEKDANVLKKHGVGDWPNVIVPNGFKDTIRQFNLDGYGLTLIDPEGIVRGIDIREDSVMRLLVEIKARAMQ